MAELEGALDLVPEHLLKMTSPEPLRLQFLLHGASFEVEGRVDAHHDRLQLGPDLRIYSANRRQHPRLVLPGLVRFGGDAGLTGKMLDVSPYGFRAEVQRSAVHRLRGFGWVELDVRAREVFGGYARLRRRHDFPTRSVLGFEFEPRRNRGEVTRALLGHAFPSIRARHQLPEDALHRMFEESGYTKLRNRAPPPDWANFTSEDSYDLVYCAQSGMPLAHLSMTRAYRSTWVVHQFASHRRHPESFASWFCLYRYLAQMPLLMDGPAALAMAYYDPRLPWHRRYLGAFGRWLNSEDDVVMSQLDRFDLDTTGGPAPRTVDGYTVSLMRPEERERCHDIALTNMPPLVARAMDLSPSSLTSHSLGCATDTMRVRDVLVLRRDGNVVACALCEQGQPSLSRFGLFDIAHVLPARCGARPDQAALQQLIEGVRHHYRARRVDQPIVTAPEATFVDPLHPAMTHIEQMGRFVMSARALRHYENFVLFTFGKAQSAVRKFRWKAA